MSLNELKYTLQPLGATVRPLDAFHTTPDLHQQTQWGRLICVKSQCNTLR